MNTVQQEPFAERFREPNTPYLSPAKVGDFFGLRVQELAERAVFLLGNEPLRAFGYKTADTLVQEGRFDAVIAYLESLAGGFAG
jgi:hypothetical protein